MSGLSVRPYALYRLTLGDIGILRTRRRVRLLNRRRAGRFDDDRAGVGGGVAPGVGGDVVDGVGCYLRRVDENVSGQNAVDECAVRQVVALVVMHDCA
jgi:hypothetical protein